MEFRYEITSQGEYGNFNEVQAYIQGLVDSGAVGDYFFENSDRLTYRANFELLDETRKKPIEATMNVRFRARRIEPKELKTPEVE